MRFFPSASLILALAALAACARTAGGSGVVPGSPSLQTASVAGAENVYAVGALHDNEFIEELSPTGRLLAKASLPNGISWLKVDPLGNVWFGPDSRHHIFVFEGGDLTKKPFLLSVRWAGSDVAFDKDGTAYVADVGGAKADGRILVYAPGASRLLDTYHIRGTYLALDPRGILYLVDPADGARELDTKHHGKLLRWILRGLTFASFTLDSTGAFYGWTATTPAAVFAKVPAGSRSASWSVPESLVSFYLASSHGYLYAPMPQANVGIYSQRDGHLVAKLASPRHIGQTAIGADGFLYVQTVRDGETFIKEYPLLSHGTPSTIGPLHGEVIFAVR